MENPVIEGPNSDLERRLSTPELGMEELTQLRQAIDDVDGRLVELIASRLDLALRTRDVKQRYGIEARDMGREAAIVKKATQRARDANLEPETVRAIFWRLIDHSWWGYDQVGPGSEEVLAKGQ